MKSKDLTLWSAMELPFSLDDLYLYSTGPFRVTNILNR